MKLTILCVTRAEPHARRFLLEMAALAAALEDAELVVAADGEDAAHRLRVVTFCEGSTVIADAVRQVRSLGYIESVLDEALGFCRGEYVLRLDDDERCSPAMARWLNGRRYMAAEHWKFPRANLWPTADHVALTPHLWPDHQTRLSVRGKAGGRSLIHSGSPFGGGEDAGVVIEHHKFLVKSLEERRAIVGRYDRIQPNAGTSFLAFSCPEDAYPDGVAVGALGDGTAARIRASGQVARMGAAA